MRESGNGSRGKRGKCRETARRTRQGAEHPLLRREARSQAGMQPGSGEGAAGLWRTPPSWLSGIKTQSRGQRRLCTWSPVTGHREAAGGSFHRRGRGRSPVCSESQGCCSMTDLCRCRSPAATVGSTGSRPAWGLAALGGHCWGRERSRFLLWLVNWKQKSTTSSFQKHGPYLNLFKTDA